MPETPESHERVAKIQKDVEELREEMEDTWHLNRERYQRMVADILCGNANCITLYLEIDGIRSINEIENNLVASGRKIPHVTLWRAEQRLLKGGLIRKIGAKSKSPIYAKKRWALALHLDDYVRSQIIPQENKP